MTSEHCLWFLTLTLTQSTHKARGWKKKMKREGGGGRGGRGELKPVVTVVCNSLMITKEDLLHHRFIKARLLILQWTLVQLATPATAASFPPFLLLPLGHSVHVRLSIIIECLYLFPPQIPPPLVSNNIISAPTLRFLLQLHQPSLLSGHPLQASPTHLEPLLLPFFLFASFPLLPETVCGDRLDAASSWSTAQTSQLWSPACNLGLCTPFPAPGPSILKSGTCLRSTNRGFEFISASDDNGARRVTIGFPAAVAKVPPSHVARRCS